MDLHDIWQENKRWILGCLIGLLVFWVGTMVIDSLWSPGKAMRENQAEVKKINDGLGKDGGFHTKEARAAAQAEGEQLQKQYAAVEAALLFKPGPDFELEGKGEPHVYFDRKVREVRSRLLLAADEYGIEVDEKAFSWTTPAGHEETRAALVALNLLDAAVTRLFTAHREITGSREAAAGVVKIESFKIDVAKTQTGGPRRGKAVEDPVEEQRVSFVFRADALTTYRFLELCRSESPPIALAPELKMESGKQSRDPLRVSGKLLALTLRQP